MMSPSDLLATPVLNAFQNVALAIIIERQNKLHFSDQCQTKFLLPKSQNEFYDLLTIPSCTSSTTTKAKGMENGLIFHVTIQIQILTMFSVQSKYSKKTKSISLLGFVISNKTCKTRNVQIRCQPSRLSSPSRWKPNSLLPMQKRSNGFISPQMSHNFHTPFWDELHSIGIRCNPSRLQHISPKFDRSIHIVRIVPLSTIQWTTSS